MPHGIRVGLSIKEVTIMKHIRLQLIPIQELNQDLYCHDGMHSDYFREFVQMMLCHAWSIGFLPSELWDAIPDIAQAATVHDIGKTALPESIINKKGQLSSAEREFGQGAHHPGCCHGGNRACRTEGRSDL